MTRLLLLGHLGNIHKGDEELVHVSPTRSREFALEFSRAGFDVTAAVYWPEAERQLSSTLQYKHIDKINAGDYDIVFCHLVLSIQQLSNLSQGEQITQGAQAYGLDKPRFQAILNHPRIYLQLDAPRAPFSDTTRSMDLIRRVKAVGVATQNAVSKWKKMYPFSNVEWINAATIAYKYPSGNCPYKETGKKRIIYLGRMNDASSVTPLEKLHNVAKLLPGIEFHVVTNKIRDDKSDKVFAINELQTGPGRELRFHEVTKLIKVPNIILHRGSTYAQSFSWMHHADCAIGFAVRPDQDVASCKSWEYFGAGVPVVLEEGTPEVWVLEKNPNGRVAPYGDWKTFANEIDYVLAHPENFKRRRMRRYIARNHGYDTRAKEWISVMEKYQ